MRTFVRNKGRIYRIHPLLAGVFSRPIASFSNQKSSSHTGSARGAALFILNAI